MSSSNTLISVAELLGKAHGSSSDAHLQKQALDASIALLRSLPDEIHWLCDTKNDKQIYLEALTECHLLWQSDTAAERDWLVEGTVKQVSRCHECARLYQTRLRRNLRHLMQSIYHAETTTVDAAFQRLDAQDASRLTLVLNSTIKRTEEAGLRLADQQGPGFESANLCALFECLWSPALLKDADLNNAFTTVFVGLRERGKLLRVANRILPGMYTFAFSTNQELKVWSRKCFEKHKKQASAEEFRNSGRDQVHAQYLALTSGKLEPAVFWAGMAFVLQFTDPLAVLSELRNVDIKLMDLICGEVSSHTRHLVPILLCLERLLSAGGTNVWSTCPIPAQQFGQVILLNPKFKELLEHPEQADGLEHGPIMVLQWIQPYVFSQSGGNQALTLKQSLAYLLDGNMLCSIPSISQAACRLQALQLLQATTEDCRKHIMSSRNYSDQQRRLQLSIRLIVDANLTYVSAFAFSSEFRQPQHDSLRTAARKVLVLAIQIDSSILWADFISLSTTKYWSTAETSYTFDGSKQVWLAIANNCSDANMDLIQQFLEVVGTNMPLIDTIEVVSSMATEHKEAVMLFNKALNAISSATTSILANIGDYWAPQQGQALLSRPDTNAALVSCIMSPNEEIYKAVLNIYKEAFQAAGRVEALRAAFQRNFESTATGFTNVFQLWSREAVFKSAVRIVRTASNILDILFNTRNGLVVSSEGNISKPSGDLFRELWTSLWHMLETAYRMALPWSVNFDKEQLIEFMRDVLECSNALLRYFTGFERIIHSDDAIVTPERQKEMDAQLLNQCVTAVKSLTTWLRLNDLELLQSCVRLVCDILQRLAKSGVRINEESIAAFDKIIVNSKKKKNNLTEAQRTEIFIALSEHTDYIEIPDDDESEPTPALPSSTVSARPVTKSVLSVHEQMKQASARSSNLTADRVRVAGAAIKSASAALAARQAPLQSAQDRAEYLRNRAALPAALRKPAAKNVSAGAVRRNDSSASESDSDSDAEGLFKINDPASAPKIKNVQKRIVQMVDPSAPVGRRPIDVRAERNRVEQNLRARTNPDLTGLHMRLLSWNPCHDGLLPPDQEGSLATVAKSFQTAHAYTAVVEPLFLLETWQHVVAAMDAIKPRDKFQLTLQTRSAVDRFVDLFATIKMELWQKFVITEPDLLLLSTTDDMSKGEKSGTVERCLAKVQSISKKRDVVEIALRTVPSSGMVRHLRPTVVLWATKLTSLTPTHREYATLKALPYYDLCDLIVTGRPTKPVASHSSDLGKIMRSYAVNEPQAKAIDAALNSTGFTLIQGPPGTGKTKTILGMVGAFLSASAIQGTAIAIPGQRQTSKKDEPIKRKILLCAPSNAAVDEIVLRLKGGIFNSKGIKYVPKVVRMGMSDAINVNVRDVTLDVLLDDMLMKNEENARGKNASGGDPAVLREKLNETLKERDVQRALLEQARKEERDTGEIEIEIKKLNNRKTQLGEQLDELRDKQSQKARAKDIERKRFQTQILAEADIICATLSGSGHDLMANVAVNFETVIIDEACQTTELSALIPLKYGCTRCIMVGDPNQLPPTVLSTEAVKYAYNESLFVRMQRNNPNAVRLLAIQYRMHSSISCFPSKHFYDGTLLDGPEVDAQTKRAWHNSTIFGTYRFFDVAGRERETASHSVFNDAEAQVCMDIYKRLKQDFFDVDFDGRIGIVTPYKEQFKVIRALFIREYGNSILSSIDFNTVDGFQGQEKDIIIFSCVRANPKRGIGFLADKRRMNVALTRAKSSVFILGSAPALRQDAVWSALVRDAEDRSLFLRVDRSTFASSTRIGKPNEKLSSSVKRTIDSDSEEEGQVSARRSVSPSTHRMKKKPKASNGQNQDKPAEAAPPGLIAVAARRQSFDKANGQSAKQATGITPRGAPPVSNPTSKAIAKTVPSPEQPSMANGGPKPVKAKPANSLFIKRKR